MTSKDFCYWLQGFFELSGNISTLDKEQVKTIKNHLNMVFKHEIDPSYGDETHQATLQEIHDGLKDKVDQILKEEAAKPPRPHHDCNPLIRC